MSYLKNILIAIDQLAHAMLGGKPDETLSAMLHRRNHWARHIVNALFFDRYHCRDSYLSEVERKQLPEVYRACLSRNP